MYTPIITASESPREAITAEKDSAIDRLKPCTGCRHHLTTQPLCIACEAEKIWHSAKSISLQQFTDVLRNGLCDPDTRIRSNPFPLEPIK
jgi:hypothetical protein